MASSSASYEQTRPVPRPAVRLNGRIFVHTLGEQSQCGFRLAVEQMGVGQHRPDPEAFKLGTVTYFRVNNR